MPKISPSVKSEKPTSLDIRGLTKRLDLSSEQVEQLFRLFFARVNLRWALLHPEVHTPAYCESKSALLFWTSKHPRIISRSVAEFKISLLRFKLLS